MITIKDVAKKAKVSPATVSRVLNGQTSVSEEKRRAVNEWIIKLGYKPNQVAQTLIGKKSYLLGVVITNISNPFFADMVRAIQQEAFYHGYSIVLCNTNAVSDIERQQVDSLLRRQIDGLLIVPTSPNSQNMKTLLRTQIPTVVITQQHKDFDSISVDHEMGGRMVASHLISSGHTKIAFFGDKHDSKYLGFRKEAIAKGLKKEHIIHVDIDYANFESSYAYEQAKEFLLSPLGKNIDGIFALNDFVAFSVINAALDVGMSVPTKVGIVGFDNTYLSMYYRPTLTSVIQPVEEMGKRAVELLGQRMEHPDKQKESIVIQPRVIIRESSSTAVK